MKTVTYEATVENGQIRLPLTVHLPEHTKVYVVVPGLAHPEDAAFFTMKVIEESGDA